MFRMLTQLWSALTVFFLGIEKFAKAFNHIATWTEESAGSFADEARVQRQAQLNKLNADAKLNVEQTQ